MTPSPVPQPVPYTATQQTCGCGINPGGGCTVSIRLHRKQLPSSGGLGGSSLDDSTRWCLFTLQRLTCDQKTQKPHVRYVGICQSRITLSPCPPKPRVKPKPIPQQPHHHNPSPSPLPNTTQIQGAIPNGEYRPLKPPHNNQKKKQFELKNQTVNMARVPKPLTITKKQ